MSPNSTLFILLNKLVNPLKSWLRLFWIVWIIPLHNIYGKKTWNAWKIHILFTVLAIFFLKCLTYLQPFYYFSSAYIADNPPPLHYAVLNGCFDTQNQFHACTAMGVNQEPQLFILTHCNLNIAIIFVFKNDEWMVAYFDK